MEYEVLFQEIYQITSQIMKSYQQLEKQVTDVQLEHLDSLLSEEKAWYEKAATFGEEFRVYLHQTCSALIPEVLEDYEYDYTSWKESDLYFRIIHHLFYLSTESLDIEVDCCILQEDGTPREMTEEERSSSWLQQILLESCQQQQNSARMLQKIDYELSCIAFAVLKEEMSLLPKELRNDFHHILFQLSFCTSVIEEELLEYQFQFPTKSLFSSVAEIEALQLSLNDYRLLKKDYCMEIVFDLTKRLLQQKEKNQSFFLFLGYLKAILIFDDIRDKEGFLEMVMGQISDDESSHEQKDSLLKEIHKFLQKNQQFPLRIEDLYHQMCSESLSSVLFKKARSLYFLHRGEYHFYRLWYPSKQEEKKKENYDSFIDLRHSLEQKYATLSETELVQLRNFVHACIQKGTFADFSSSPNSALLFERMLVNLDRQLGEEHAFQVVLEELEKNLYSYSLLPEKKSEEDLYQEEQLKKQFHFQYQVEAGLKTELDEVFLQRLSFKIPFPRPNRSSYYVAGMDYLYAHGQEDHLLDIISIPYQKVLSQFYYYKEADWNHHRGIRRELFQKELRNVLSGIMREDSGYYQQMLEAVVLVLGEEVSEENQKLYREIVTKLETENETSLPQPERWFHIFCNADQKRNESYQRQENLPENHFQPMIDRSLEGQIIACTQEIWNTYLNISRQARFFTNEEAEQMARLLEKEKDLYQQLEQENKQSEFLQMLEKYNPKEKIEDSFEYYLTADDQLLFSRVQAQLKSFFGEEEVVRAYRARATGKMSEEEIPGFVQLFDQTPSLSTYFTEEDVLRNYRIEEEIEAEYEEIVRALLAQSFTDGRGSKSELKSDLHQWFYTWLFAHPTLEKTAQDFSFRAISYVLFDDVAFCRRCHVPIRYFQMLRTRTFEKKTIAGIDSFVSSNGKVDSNSEFLFRQVLLWASLSVLSEEEKQAILEQALHPPFWWGESVEEKERRIALLSELSQVGAEKQNLPVLSYTPDSKMIVDQFSNRLSTAGEEIFEITKNLFLARREIVWAEQQVSSSSISENAWNLYDQYLERERAWYQNASPEVIDEVQEELYRTISDTDISTDEFFDFDPILILGRMKEKINTSIYSVDLPLTLMQEVNGKMSKVEDMVVVKRYIRQLLPKDELRSYCQQSFEPNMIALSLSRRSQNVLNCLLQQELERLRTLPEKETEYQQLCSLWHANDFYRGNSQVESLWGDRGDHFQKILEESNEPAVGCHMQPAACNRLEQQMMMQLTSAQLQKYFGVLEEDEIVQYFCKAQLQSYLLIASEVGLDLGLLDMSIERQLEKCEFAQFENSYNRVFEIENCRRPSTLEAVSEKVYIKKIDQKN